MFHGYSQSGPSVDCRRHHRLRDRRRHHRRRRHDHGLRGNHRLDDGLLDNRLLHNDRLLHHHGLLHDRRRRVPRRIVGVAGGVIPDVVVPAAAVMGMDEATPPADKARRTGAAVEARPVAPARRRRRRRWRAVEATPMPMPGRRRRRAVEAAPMPGRRRRRAVETAGATRAAAGTGAAMHAGPRAASARTARTARTATGPARMRKHHARAACDKHENQLLVIHVMPPSCCVVLHVPYRRKGAPPAAV